MQAYLIEAILPAVPGTGKHYYQITAPSVEEAIEAGLHMFADHMDTVSFDYVRRNWGYKIWVPQTTKESTP